MRKIVYWTLIQGANGPVGYYADGESNGNWRIQNFQKAPNPPIILHDPEEIKAWLQKARPEPKYSHVYLEPTEFQKRTKPDLPEKETEQ